MSLSRWLVLFLLYKRGKRPGGCRKLLLAAHRSLPADRKLKRTCPAGGGGGLSQLFLLPVELFFHSTVGKNHVSSIDCLPKQPSSRAGDSPAGIMAPAPTAGERGDRTRRAEQERDEAQAPAQETSVLCLLSLSLRSGAGASLLLGDSQGFRASGWGGG